MKIRVVDFESGIDEIVSIKYSGSNLRVIEAMVWEELLGNTKEMLDTLTEIYKTGTVNGHKYFISRVYNTAICSLLIIGDTDKQVNAKKLL